MDKTGTITEGKPKITALHIFDSDEQLTKNILFSIEKQSEHPLARAITNYLSESTFLDIAEFENISGMGVKASFKNDRKTYLLGNRKLLSTSNIVLSNEQEEILSELTTEGNTVVFLANKNSCLAIAGIDDVIKPGAIEAINSFQQKGVEVIMLTGDNEAAAKKKAVLVDIKNVVADVLPTEKAEVIQQLQAEGKKVGMVGDGINDAPALAQADVSIAMGTGTDVSIETAQVVILKGKISNVFKAYTLSSQTVTTIKQNLFWAFIYNIIGIPIAAGILYPINGFMLNPMIAGAAMAFSSVSVVANSLRLKGRKL